MGESGVDWAPRQRARRRALQALYQWQMTGQEAGDIITQFLETQDFESVDTVYFDALVRDVISQSSEIGQRLEPCLDRPLKDCDVMERVVLLIGGWLLLYEHDLPRAVALDESIELAKRFGSAQSPVYVNGVLDKASRAWANSTSSG